MKHVKLFENFVNEAKVDARGFEDEFASLIFDIEEDHGEEIGDDAIAAILTVVWDEVVEQNNFHEMIGSLGLVFRNAKVAIDDDFRRGYAKKAAVDFGANMYDSTGFGWSGTMECFKPLFSYAGANASQVRKIEKQLNDFFTNESKESNESDAVNENKYASAGKLGYNDQFLNKRKSLAKTISTELGLTKEFTGPWVGFDYIDMYAVGPNGVGGTILSGALDGSHTYDDLKAAAAEYLKGKNVKISE